MSVNKLTPHKNVLWESSRMMLPEHKEALIERDRQIIKKQRPELDEQRLDELSHIMVDSLQNRIPIKVTLFEEDEHQFYIGIVEHIDPQAKCLKLSFQGTYYRLSTLAIVDATYTRESARGG